MEIDCNQASDVISKHIKEIYFKASIPTVETWLFLLKESKEGLVERVKSRKKSTSCWFSKNFFENKSNVKFKGQKKVPQKDLYDK